MIEKEEINWLIAVIEEKGMSWVIAAMVEGSIGYHTPAHAKKLIEAFLNGEKENFCERCYCCYNANLEKMILSDVKSFECLEEYNPQKVERIIKYTEKMMGVDTMTAMTGSLMYPTMT
jgi:hypothetical protein